MGYWGWRPLLLSVFVSVWVVGCNIVSDASPGVSPTPSPRVTLTVRRIASPTPTTAATQVAVQPPTAEATDQASPTPVLYTIQPDDTLGAIALRFGIPLAELQAANPDVDARALQPGQTLVIPITPDATALPTATATPPDLILSPPTCYETLSGSLLCLGEVANTLDYPLEQVALDVQVLDSDGALLADAQVEIEQAIVPVDGTAPYRALFDIEPDNAARAVARLTRADAAQEIESRFVTLDVEDDALEQVDGRFAVTATLVNSDDDTAQDIRLVATLRDDEGRVVGYRVARVPQALAPGDSLPARLEIVAQPGAESPSYSLHAEARRAPDDA